MARLRHFAAVIAVALVGLAIPVTAGAQQRPPTNRRNFVSCPVVRDTPTVPCFLAEFEGETYFLGIQQDTGAAWYPPQLGHRVLVEGTVSNGPRVCGGIALTPVVTSVLPELDAACNTVLPAEEGIEAPHGERGPGPSSERREPAPAPAQPAAPQPPFAARTFTIPFDFDNDFMPGRVTRIVSDAVRYAQASKAAHVAIVGYRGSVLLSDGKTIGENPAIAERRAKKLGVILKGLGVPAASVDVTWKTEPEAADGVNDAQKRRAVVSITP